MYLFLISLGMGLAYLFLYQIYSVFFTGKLTKYSLESWKSIVIILVFSLVVNKLALLIVDRELGNRVMHAFGGGFLAFFTCFLVVKNLKLRMNIFPFILFSFLIVMSLGIANELLEFFLQSYSPLIFANSINDTWLDLTSNFIGTIVAIAIFTPFIRNK
ncbi:hypothetical protein IT412_05485 [Candidatus Peregrinibacteria bacterium]|nr:hypothetical protein [Candidatus Peregrinibacteria bacterium]